MTTASGSSTGPTPVTLRAAQGTVDVLTVGPYFCDIVYSGLPRLPREGEELWATECAVVPGGSYITALALHRLGVSSAWVVAFGTDPFSRFVRQCAEGEGMDPVAYLNRTAELTNVSTSLSFGTDRSFVSYAGQAPGASVDDVVAAILRLRPRVVMWPGVPSPEQRRALVAAHDIGAVRYVDPQSSPLHVSSPELAQLLADVDVFAPNEREACQLTGEHDPLVAVDHLVELTPLVVLKRGPKGALAADRNGRQQVPAIPIEPVETTGAGDCFNAGFVMALVEGETLIDCLRTGNATGALSTSAASSSGVPHRVDVNRARRCYAQR